MAQPAGVPAQIEAMIADALYQGILAACKTNIPVGQIDRADNVIIGKPGSELSDPITISIHVQHPIGPSEDVDKQVTGMGAGLSDRPYSFPNETIGGMRVDELKGGVQINIREDLEPESAVWVNAAIKQRVKDVINQSTSFDYMEDEMGNLLLKIETFRDFGYDAGARDVSVHFRWVGWRAYICYANYRTGAQL